jgi:hypothetical protein
VELSPGQGVHSNVPPARLRPSRVPNEVPAAPDVNTCTRPFQTTRHLINRLAARVLRLITCSSDSTGATNSVPRAAKDCRQPRPEDHATAVTAVEQDVDGMSISLRSSIPPCRVLSWKNPTEWCRHKAVGRCLVRSLRSSSLTYTCPSPSLCPSSIDNGVRRRNDHRPYRCVFSAPG